MPWCVSSNRLQNSSSPRDHQGFDSFGDLRCRVFVELEIVLEIPADALAIVRREFEADVAAELQLLKIWNFSRGDLDPIAMRRIATLLIDPQDRHEIHSAMQGFATTKSRIC